MAKTTGPTGDAALELGGWPDARGWWRFKYRHAGLCRCGHEEWHHTGLREPGCSHLGTCCCEAFDPSGRH